jgi:hypothetical protein
VGVSQPTSQAAFETLRFVATAYLGMAGFYQRWILRRSVVMG